MGQLLGNVLKGMNHILPHPFFFPAGWKVNIREGFSMAILNHEATLGMKSIGGGGTKYEKPGTVLSAWTTSLWTVMCESKNSYSYLNHCPRGFLSLLSEPNATDMNN